MPRDFNFQHNSHQIPNFRTLFMDIFSEEFKTLPKLYWDKPQGRFVSVALALKVLHEYGALDPAEEIIVRRWHKTLQHVSSSDQWSEMLLAVRHPTRFKPTPTWVVHEHELERLLRRLDPERAELLITTITENPEYV